MTVSLPTDVAVEVQKLAKRREFASRSAVVERALHLLVRQLRQEHLAGEFEEYFSSETEAERREMQAMTAALRLPRLSVDLDKPSRRSKRRPT